MKINEIESKDITYKTLKGEFPGPFKITAGPRPKGWRGPENDTSVYVMVKNTEPRGVPAQVMRGLLGRSVSFEGNIKGPARKAGVTDVYTSSGMDTRKLASRWNITPPVGLVFKFKNVDAETAKQRITEFLASEMAYRDREKQKQDSWKAKALERKKEAAKYYKVQYQKQRQELYDKYGKRNVQSVSARQIGGDDGHQYYILIHGRPVEGPMAHYNVPYAKLSWYGRLLNKNGKV